MFNVPKKEIGTLELETFKTGYIIFEDPKFNKQALYYLLSNTMDVQYNSNASFNYYFEDTSIEVDVIDEHHLQNINMSRKNMGLEIYPYFKKDILKQKYLKQLNEQLLKSKQKPVSDDYLNNIDFNNCLYLCFSDIADMQNRINKRCNLALKYILCMLDQMHIKYQWINCIPGKRIIRNREVL